MKTKKVAHKNADNHSTPMKPKQTKAQLLQKLNEAADAARDRVSGYSDDRRSELEQLARGIIRGANPKQVCGR